jgi:hypothetical protein
MLILHAEERVGQIPAILRPLHRLQGLLYPRELLGRARLVETFNELASKVSNKLNGSRTAQTYRDNLFQSGRIRERFHGPTGESGESVSHISHKRRSEGIEVERMLEGHLKVEAFTPQRHPHHPQVV